MKQFIIDSQGIKRSAEEVTCAGCDKIFLKVSKEIKKCKLHYCSRECRIKSLYVQSHVEIICSWCQKPCIRRTTSLKTSKSGLYFCSVSCKNTAQSINGLSEITPGHYGTGQRYSCKFCGIKTGKSQYCYEHKTNRRFDDYIQRWKKGEETGNSANNETLNQHVRRYMFEKYGSKCVKCGWSRINPITGKIPLTINHIDGDSSNSIEDNLELICPNCHSLTPNYGALNKGNGRKIRREKLGN